MLVVTYMFMYVVLLSSINYMQSKCYIQVDYNGQLKYAINMQLYST